MELSKSDKSSMLPSSPKSHVDRHTLEQRQLVETKAREHLQRMETEPILPLLLKLSVPTIIAMICTTIYTNADVSFIGQYEGNAGLAAAGIFTPFQGLVYLAICLALATGVSACIAPALGRKDYKGANDALIHFVIIGSVYSLFLPAVILPWVPILVRLLGASTGVVADYAMSYAYVMAGFGPLSFFLGVAMANVTRNENRPIVAMLLQVTAAAVNIFVDAILFPLSGWYLHIQAAAIGTVIANVLTGFIAILNFSGVLRQGLLRFTLCRWRDLQPVLFWRILVTGLPQLLFLMPANLCPILGNTIIRNLDISSRHPGLSPLEASLLRNNYQGAFGVATRVTMICIMPANGIYQGFLSILGYNLGAKRYRRVYQLIYISMIAVVLTMAVLWGVMQGIAHYFVLVYINKKDVVLRALAARILRLLIAGFPILGFIFIASGIAQMEHRPWIALLLQLSRALITIVFLYAFPYAIMKGDLGSIFYAFMVADISVSTVSGIVLWYYLVKYRRLYRKQEAETGDSAHGDARLDCTVQKVTAMDPAAVSPLPQIVEETASAATLGHESIGDLNQALSVKLPSMPASPAND